MMKAKSLTQRAAAAMKSPGTSAELNELRRELTHRIDAVDAQQKSMRSAVDRAEANGDLEELKAARNSLSDLNDEEKILRRLCADMYQIIKTVKGAEIMASAETLRKDLAGTVEKAAAAQRILDECLIKARNLVSMRMDAAAVGHSLVLGSESIRSIAELVLPDGNERKQLMIDLGLRESIQAERVENPQPHVRRKVIDRTVPLQSRRY